MSAVEGYKPDTRVRCQYCGKDTDNAWRTHRVNAVESDLMTTPDGTGFATTVRAATTCSWHCLAAVIAQWEERPEVGEPF